MNTMNSFHVRGASRHDHGQGVLHLVQTPDGWKQRVVDGDSDFKNCLNFDYVCKESTEELQSWLKCDLKEMSLTSAPVLNDGLSV